MTEPALLAEAVALLRELVPAADRIAGALERLAEREAPDSAAEPAPALLAALREFFGSGPFSSTGVLMAADESPPLAEAVAAIVDMNLPEQARVVSLGRSLARLPGLVPAGDRRGARLWRVRG